MERRPTARTLSGRALVPVVVGAAGIALSLAATSPFTWSGDAVTALALIAFVVGAVWSWPARPRRRHGWGRGALPWAGLCALGVAWELVQLFSPGGRADHPTLSSLADALDRFRPIKALVAAAWLGLGAWILLAGRATSGRAISDPADPDHEQRGPR